MSGEIHFLGSSRKTQGQTVPIVNPKIHLLWSAGYRHYTRTPWNGGEKEGIRTLEGILSQEDAF